MQSRVRKHIGFRKEKGQGVFNLAQLSNNLMDKQFPTETVKNISFKSIFVKSGWYKSPHHAFIPPISTPQAGFEPAFHSSVENCLIQLDDRGDFSFDNKSSIILIIYQYLMLVSNGFRERVLLIKIFDKCAECF